MVRRNWIEALTRFSMAEFDDFMMIRGSALRENDNQAARKFVCDAYSRLVQTTSEHSVKLVSMEAMLFETKNTLSQLSNRLGQHPIDAEFSQHVPPVTNFSDPYVHGDVNSLSLDNRKSVSHTIEMPQFDGYNASDWLSKVERFFRVGRYSDLDKLDLVAFSLEGDVLKWFNWEVNRCEFHSWEEFRRRLFLRFGTAPEEAPGNRRFAIKQNETVSAYVTELEELSAQVIEQQTAHKEESITHHQIPVSKLEHSLQIHKESSNVCENSQDVVGCDELGTEEIMFSGLSHTSHVWEPGGVLADHVLVDWFMDFPGYDGIVDGIRCFAIGVCSEIKQPIDSRRASRVWESGGLDISTELLLHSDFETEVDIDKLQRPPMDTIAESVTTAPGWHEACDAEIDALKGTGTCIVTSLPARCGWLVFDRGKHGQIQWTEIQTISLYKAMVADPIKQAVLNLVTNAARFGFVSVLCQTHAVHLYVKQDCMQNQEQTQSHKFKVDKFGRLNTTRLTVLRVLCLLSTLFWSTSFKKQKFGKNWWYKFKHSLWQRECGRDLLLEEDVLVPVTVVTVRYEDVLLLILGCFRQTLFVSFYPFTLEVKRHFNGGSIDTFGQEEE